MMKKNLALFLVAVITAASMGGCASDGGKVKLDPKNPVSITVWHYYNGAILNAFEQAVTEFNETEGLKQGIIVEGRGYGNISELEKVIVSSANKEIGSMDMPNIFASYADTAYETEKLGLLADLGEFFSKEEQDKYLDSFIEEGKIGLNGELRIFPVAKSTEALMINETDWLPFAEAYGLTYDDLKTMEGVARVAELYYQWTDSKTPDVKDDGKAFFGRDVMANLFIVASKEFGTEIFEVENGVGKININPEVMRKIWDYYYVPFISGYFLASGKFRSDDAKVGDVLSYVGSTASASYFPKEVTVGTDVYPITAKILPAPLLEGGRSVMVQQGAGMVVTKDTPQREYASVVFLKWFTRPEKNIEFASLSGYMPVQKEAIDYEKIRAQAEAAGTPLGEITDETLRVAIYEMQNSEMYTNKAFDGGTAARAVLEYHLHDKAVADREAVLQMMTAGSRHEEAVAHFNTNEQFRIWMEEITAALNRVTA